jgi:hypothetical protein
MAKRNRNKQLHWMHVRSVGVEIEGKDTALSAALKRAATKSLKDLGFHPLEREVMMHATASWKRNQRKEEKRKRELALAAIQRDNQISIAWQDHYAMLNTEAA